MAKLNRKFCKFLVKTRRLYRKNSNFCNIFFSIFAGCAIGLIAFQLFAPKPKYPTELKETSTPPKTKNLIVKRLLVENLNCLKIKGQTVIVEKRHKELSYAVFEFPIEAKLSVSLSGLKNINNDILTLSQPFVSSARINHNKKTLRAYRYNKWLNTADEMERAASVKTQSRIEKIANGEDMKSLARKHAEILIPKLFFPEKDITIKWKEAQ